MGEDNWRHRSIAMRCRSCIFFVLKEPDEGIEVSVEIGRCRRRAPTMKGFPAVYRDDWCGDHKLDENRI